MMISWVMDEWILYEIYGIWKRLVMFVLHNGNSNYEDDRRLTEIEEIIKIDKFEVIQY